MVAVLNRVQPSSRLTISWHGSRARASTSICRSANSARSSPVGDTSKIDVELLKAL